MSSRYTPKTLVKYLTKLQRTMMPAITRGIWSGAARGVTLIQRSVVGAVDTSQYKNAWRWSKLPEGGAIITNSKKYAPVIEKGRRKNSAMPPLQVIEKWAMRKLGLTRKQAKAAAWPIAKAIAKRGIPGRHPEGRVAEQLIEMVVAEVRHEIDLAVKGSR